MANITPFPIVGHYALLVQAKQENSLKPLLEAIRLVALEKLDGAPIVQAWADAKTKIDLITFEAFASFLMAFDFSWRYTKSDADPVPALNNGNAELSERVRQYQSEVGAPLERAKEHATRPEVIALQKRLVDDYGSFTPAHQLAHLLPKYFPDGDPGKVIGEYMKTLFVDSGRPVRADFSKFMVCDRDLANSILEIGIACLHKDEAYDADKKDLLISALSYIISKGEAAAGPDPVANFGALFDAIEIAPSALALKLLWKWGDPVRCDKFQPPSVNQFTALLNRIGVDENAGKIISLPFLAIDLMRARVRKALDEGASENGDFVVAIIELLNRIHDHAVRKLGSRSPIDEQAACECAFWNQLFICWESYDLRFALADANNLDCPSGLHTWDHTGNAYAAMDHSSHSRAYFDLFDACEGETLLHLASAILAFFIFSQSVGQKGKIDVSSELVTRINRATTYPGYEMVLYALNFAHAYAEKDFPLDAIAIRALLPKDNTQATTNIVELATARAANRISKVEIAAAWEADLSSSRWNRLSDKCKDYLVQGDFYWRLIFIKHCRDITDMGAIGLDYAKAIEAELGARLDWMPSSVLYKQYCDSAGIKPAKTLTLGMIVKTLQRKRTLPEQLRAEIEKAGVFCHRSPDLMRQLEALHELRNEAAHPKHFGAAEYTQLKELARAMMPRFAELIGPQD